MKDIIELLQNERTKTVDALKQGEQDKLSHLQQLDKALGCHDHAEPGQVFLLENLESACQLAAEGYGIAFNFYQYMKNFHYPKPVRCFRIGNPDDTTSYSIVTLKGKQTLPAMEELIRLLQESA